LKKKRKCKLQKRKEEAREGRVEEEKGERKGRES
jgi:hypothetical protein